MLLMILPCVCWPTKEKDEDTLRQANLVLQAFPQQQEHLADFLVKSNCVLILPNVKKFGFGIGGSWCAVLCSAQWQNLRRQVVHPCDVFSRAVFERWFPVGGSSTDFVLLLMTPKVVNQILNGRPRWATDATAAAGPAPQRPSASDAEILTYGKAEGYSLAYPWEAQQLEPDNDANHRLYAQDADRNQYPCAETGVQPTTEGKVLGCSA